MSARRTKRTYTLRVRVTLDTSSMENLRKQISRAVSEGAERGVSSARRKIAEGIGEVKGDVGESIIGVLREKGAEELAGIPIIGRFLAGRGAGAGAGLAGLGGIGGIFVIAGAIFFIVEILQKIADMVRAIVDRLRKVSAIFDSLFKIVDMIWTLVLKPFADIIGLLIRPFLIIIMKYLVIPFYRSMLPFIQMLARTFKPETVMKVFEIFFPALTRFMEDLRSERGQALAGLFGGTAGMMVAMPFLMIFLLPLMFLESLMKLYYLISDFIDIISRPFRELSEIDWGKVGEKVGEVFEGLGKWFDDNILKPISSIDLSPVWKFFEDIRDKISGMLSNAWNELVGFFSGLDVKFLEDVWGGLVGFFGTLSIEKLEGIWNSVKGFFGRVWESITNTLEPAWNAIKKFGESVYDTLKSVVKSLVGGIIEAAEKIANVFIDIANGFVWFYNNVIYPIASFVGKPFGLEVPRLEYFSKVDFSEIKQALERLIEGGRKIEVNMVVYGSVYNEENLKRLMENTINEALRRQYDNLVRGAK